MKEQQDLGHFDEKYPGYVAEGIKGYFKERAFEMKRQKESEMRKNPKVVSVQVEVVPLTGMNAQPEQYYVHNTSSYKK